MGLRSHMAQASGDRGTAAQPCHESLAWCLQVLRARVGSARSSPASLEPQPRPGFGSRGLQGRTSPMSVPSPAPRPGPPSAAITGKHAFLRKPLLTAGDTAAEYKKIHRHTNKDKPGPGRLQPPCPAQGTS